MKIIKILVFIIFLTISPNLFSQIGLPGGDGCPSGQSLWYRDADGDGYGDPQMTVCNQTKPAGYTTNNTDCNDNSSVSHTNATEICDGIDNDCDGQIDEGFSTLSSGSINGSQTVCYSGSPSTLANLASASGGTGSYSYKWEYSTNGSSGWTNISGATSLTYNPPGSMTSSRWYRRMVQSCGQTKYSASVKVTVNPSLTAGSIGGTQMVCYGGDPATLGNTASPGGGDGTYSIQWQWALLGSATWNNINGETSSLYNAPSGQTQTRRYQRRVISCGQTAYSNEIVITVNPLLGSATGSNVSRCGSGTLTLTASVGSGGNTIRWFSASSGGTLLHTGTGYTTPSLSSTTSYYAESYNSSTGCTAGTRKQIQAIINTVPVLAGGSNISRCGSGTLTLTASVGSGGNTIRWYSAASGGTLLYTGTNFTTPSLSNTTTYYAENYNSSTTCAANSRKQLQAIVNTQLTWYADTDGDGYGNSNSSLTSCTQLANYVSNGSDYDDTTANINNIQPQYFYQDVDGDGFGDPNSSLYYSLQPAGYVINNTDNCPDEAGTYNGCDYTPPTFSDENYVYTRSYQRAMDDDTEIFQNKDIIESISYFDGLGRPMQNLNIKGSPTKKDIVAHMEYDVYGRVPKDYLPYEAAGTLGSYRTGAASATNSYYQGNYSSDINTNYLNPFSEKEFEPSPLNRVAKQAAPGYDWRLGGGHEIEFEYSANNNTDEVRLYTVTFSGGNTASPTLTGGTTSYGVGELYENITKDENHPGTTTKNHTTEEFTDKQGRVVLKRTYANVGTPSLVEAHDTYYVYDDFGNLTYVLPPLVNTSDGVSNMELSELCYQYKYDHRNRLIEKKIPGKGWEYIVYNKLDQPILTQDEIQRTKAIPEWLFTKYDAFGRVVISGVVYINQTRPQLQSSADSSGNQYETPQGQFYTMNTFPVLMTNPNTIYTVHFYDTYDFDLKGFTIPTVVLGQDVATNTKGLATGTAVRVLVDGAEKWIGSFFVYDKKGRVIYTVNGNEYLETVDIVETQLDFPGKVIYTRATHRKGMSALPIVVEDYFTYDHMGRLLKQEQEIGGATEVIAENAYDNLGQLFQKKVGGNLQTVDYTYNIRGWLKQINDPTSLGTDLFAFKINYNTIDHNATPLFNGNISETQWRTANTDNSLKWYDYSYDPLNRITAATGNTSNYNLSNVSYDKMGNITLLNRNGHTNTEATTFGVMDNLVYSYDAGNKLTKVLDNGNDTFGFKDSSADNQDYWYDVNGNMTRDLNKGIGTTSANGITYNHLNLPTEVKFDNSSTKKINYIYDAIGTKLKKKVANDSTEYAGNYIYENGDLQMFSNEEGYVTPKDVNDYSAGFDYVYQFKDHLGNTRLSYTDANDDGNITQNEIIKESNYYPFGLEHKGYNGRISPLGNSVAKKFMFGGKEYNDELGLDWYDVSVRNYDPALGRWMNIDPLASEMPSWSPYNFAYNNPIRYVDPLGLAPEDFVLGKNGNIYWDDNANSQATTQSGDTYLGKELSFTFNSTIDANLWDGPGGDGPAGDKLTSTVNLSASENSDGQLTGISATSNVEIGSTPLGTARDYFPGLGDDQNKFSSSLSTNANGTLSNFSLNFEQHASVSPIEGFGLNLMGYDIVNVAQKLDISTSGSNLSISASTDVFPSASLSVNGNQLFNYNQPSFKATHGRSTSIGGDNGRGGVDVITTPRRPKPSFQLRYKN